MAAVVGCPMLMGIMEAAENIGKVLGGSYHLVRVIGEGGITQDLRVHAIVDVRAEVFGKLAGDLRRNAVRRALGDAHPEGGPGSLGGIVELTQLRSCGSDLTVRH